MSSINEHRVRQRVTHIYDMWHASQGAEEGLKEHVKTMMRGVGLHKETMGSASDFNKEIGSI